MKKLFSFCLCAAIIALTVFSYTHADAKGKMTASTMTAVMGAAVVRPAGKKQALLAKLRKDFPANPVIEEGELRMEAILVNGQGEYTFRHKRTGATESSTEILLNEQDLFVAYDAGIFLMAEDQTVKGTGTLSTYPNVTEFPDETGFVVNKHLEHIYNGRLKVVAGDTIYNNGMAVRDARFIGTAQQTSGSNRSEVCAGAGFLGITQTYKIKGTEKVDLILKVPSDSNHKIQSNTTVKNKVVLILKGYTVTGAGFTK